MYRQFAPVVSLALLLLASCANAITMSGKTAGSIPTRLGTPTPTKGPTLPTPVPTVSFSPVDAPTGWHVLAGRHFAIAYPSDWEAQAPVPITDTTIADATGYTYALTHPSDGRMISILERWDSELVKAYCHVNNSYPNTMAGAPVRYTITGNNNELRDWVFGDDQNVLFELTANDAHSRELISFDNELLATLRFDDITPTHC
jgi:hypothetical protein